MSRRNNYYTPIDTHKFKFILGNVCRSLDIAAHAASRYVRHAVYLQYVGQDTSKEGQSFK